MQKNVFFRDFGHFTAFFPKDSCLFYALLRVVPLQQKQSMDFSFSSIEQLPNAKASVAFVPDSGTVFREDAKLDSRVLNGGQRYIPWGMDNQMPYNIISKIEDDETLATTREAPQPHGSPLRGLKAVWASRFQNKNFAKFSIGEEERRRP